MIEAIPAVVILFVPGIVLLYLPQMKRWAPASALEKVVVGSVVWTSFLVFAGYLVSISSNSAQEFFAVYADLSIAILAYGAYEGVRRLRKARLGIRRSLENLPFAIVLFALALFVLSLVLAHSIYQEYDALFYYLPLAKSILLTGGLQFDFYHQTVQTTSIEPAIPMMYAFAGFLVGDQSQIASATRLIPFAYICLSCATIYLAGKEISQKAVVGLASAGLFLAMPIISTFASNFSLYLDVPFVFLVALILYSIVKVYASGQENSSWWPVLGLSLALALFERDIAYFIFFPVLAIFALLFLRSRGRASIPATIGLALLFAGAYNFFFVYDLRNSALDAQNLLARELPVAVVMVLFIILASTPLEGLKAPRLRTLLYAASPFVLVAVLLARNALKTQSITSNLPLSNPTLSEALALLAQAGRPSVPSTNLPQLFQWGTLFYSLQLGALFLIPTVIGLVVTIWRVTRKATDGRERTRMFILLSSFLAMLLVWSWLFGSSFAGPEVRRLYYFAPFVAIFGGIGLASVAERLETPFVRLRIPLFLAATAAYFWYEEVGVSWNLAKVSSSLGVLGNLNLSLFIGLSAIFVLSLYPLRVSTGSTGGAANRDRDRVVKVVAVLFILVSSSFIAYNSASILSTESQTANLAPKDWENGLPNVIQFLDSQNNTYAVVSTGGLPLAYFTSHPVIESTTYFGLESLLAMNSSFGSLANDLLGEGIHYLLVPKPGNTFYNYSTKLGDNISVMNQAFISQTPNLVLIQSFDKYQLYQVVADQNLTGYRFLTNFNSGWATLDAASQTTFLPNGILVSGGSPRNLTIADDNQASFWTAAKASGSDEMSIANDRNQKATGNDSLRISLKGSGGMVIDHYYNQPQNWSASSVLSLYFYGADTSKSVSLTFHTNGWSDYFAKSFVDNSTGWRLIRFPLDSFVRYGSPTWSSVSFVEFLMGNRTATYWIDGLSVGGYRLGVVGKIPPMKAVDPTDYLVASVAQHNAGSVHPVLIISTTNATRVFDLQDGVNTVSLPSWFLTNGATVELLEPALSSKDSITLYYLGALTPPAG